MLITDDYRAANAALHGVGNFGTTAPRFVGRIRELAETMGAASIIDYGSGTHRWIERAFPNVPVQSYDPCVPELAGEARPADLLVSCDVLEHIEPDCLDAVLDDMWHCTNRAAFLTIATRPAKKTLPDGRNAHLIIQGAAWWLPRLMARWELRSAHVVPGELICIMETKP